MKLTNNLWLHEYFPQPYIDKYGERHCVRMLDRNLVLSDQFLRDRFGAITINTKDGRYKYSGVRPLQYIIEKRKDKTLYPGLPTSINSMHVFGKASDKKFNSVTIDEVYEDIKANVQLYYNAGIRRIENIEYTRGNTQDWFHTDTHEAILASQPQIFVVNPINDPDIPGVQDILTP